MTIILNNYPPSTLQGVGLGGRKNPRIIVGENYCHFGASYRSSFLLIFFGSVLGQENFSEVPS